MNFTKGDTEPAGAVKGGLGLAGLGPVRLGRALTGRARRGAEPTFELQERARRSFLRDGEDTGPSGAVMERLGREWQALARHGWVRRGQARQAGERYGGEGSAWQCLARTVRAWNRRAIHFITRRATR